MAGRLTMRLEFGSTVRCVDGAFGELADVVVDPTTRCVTHLVVEPHHRHSLARLVPIELAAQDGAHSAVVLSCSVADARRLAHVQDFAYLRLGEFPVNDPESDVGTEDVLALPYFDYEWLGAPSPLDPHVSLLYDRIPKGEVEIRRASSVVSADGHHLGHVDGLLVDADDHITHVLLEHGRLFGRRELAIAIGAVAKVETDSVSLTLTRDQVAELPAIRVRHRRS